MGYSSIQKLKKNPPAWKRDSQNNTIGNTNYFQFFHGKLEKSDRICDWELHVSSIRNIIPWWSAYGNINYARYVSSYLSEMSHLKEEHQYVHTYLKCGGITLQIGDDNPFGKIPLNQACEETVNKNTQTPGGAKAFSLKSKAVSKYYLVAEYRSIFMRNMKDMLNLSKSSWLQKMRPIYNHCYLLLLSTKRFRKLIVVFLTWQKERCHQL